MKIAVTGKGGVGKTTVAAHLARCWRDLSHRVVAVDADPDANLAGTLGYRGPAIAPLTSLKTLINERVGGGEGWGGFLKMNPRVDDIPAQVGVEFDGLRVLVMGTIERGRRGCACPENVLLREVLSHLLLRHDEHVVVDMEAGIEHLGRGTAEGVDRMLIVVEPGWASLDTAKRIEALARDIGVTRVGIVANKITSEADAAFVREHLGGGPAEAGSRALPLLAMLPYDRGVEAQARSGQWNREGPYYQQMLGVARTLEEETSSVQRAAFSVQRGSL